MNPQAAPLRKVSTEMTIHEQKARVEPIQGVHKWFTRYVESVEGALKQHSTAKDKEKHEFPRHVQLIANYVADFLLEGKCLTVMNYYLRLLQTVGRAQQGLLPHMTQGS